jgi:nitrogen fixation protein NifU and related proteins
MTDRNELNDLYQEVILEHSKAPRNYRRPDTTNHTAEGYNPLCGDHYTVFLELDGDTVRDIGFQGAGCAISKASASMMTQIVKGKSKAEATKLFEQFHKLVTGEDGNDEAGAGKLAVFAGVRKFPARVKCATLAWHTLQSALEGGQEVSTE